MKNALAHLRKVDKKLGAVMKKIKLETLRPDKNYFRALTESILSQQLSVKASDTIIARMKALFPGKDFPTVKDILKAKPGALRKAGVSWQKISYLKDLGRHVDKKKIDFGNIHKLPDEEVIRELIAVKGIGRWTAEMFLIFHLRRPDVFSAGDLGLQNAVKRLYGKRKHPKEKELLKLSGIWAPHRSLASRYLWASLRLE